MTWESCIHVLSDVPDIVSGAPSAAYGKHKKNISYSTDLKLCLPPIATFSHHSTYPTNSRLRSYAKHCCSRENDAECRCPHPSTGCAYPSAFQQSTRISCKRHRRLLSPSRRNANSYQCNWPSCPLAAIKKQFKKACHLRYHMSLHTGDAMVSCPECGREFNRPCYLRQHMVVHSKDKRYICQFCNRKYTHKSEASLCRKRHRTKDEQDTTDNNAITTQHTGTTRTPMAVVVSPGHVKSSAPPQSATVKTQLSALELELAIDRSKVRPYVCSMCPRRYTDPGSLRKHVRSHHPRANQSEQHQQTWKTQPQHHVDHTEEVATQVATDLLVTDRMYHTQENDFPSVQPDEPEGAAAELQVNSNVDVPVFPGTMQPPSAANSAALLLSSSTTSCLAVGLGDSGNRAYEHLPFEQEDLDPEQIPVQQRLIGTEFTDAELSMTSSACWNSPVDLCNSAMCLQTIPDRVVDFSSSSRPEWTIQTQNPTSWSLGSGIGEPFQSCEQAGALDLTDTPSYLVHLSAHNEAIDLSGGEAVLTIPSYPIDLSSTHPFIDPPDPSSQQGTSTMAPSVYHYGLSSGAGGNSLSASFSVPFDPVDIQHLIAVGHLQPTATEFYTHWEPEPGFSFTDLLLASNDEPSLEVSQNEGAVSFVDQSATGANECTVDKMIVDANEFGEAEVIATSLKHQLENRQVCRVFQEVGTANLNKCLPPLDLRLSL